MRRNHLLLLTVLLSFGRLAYGNLGLFTYYETPLDGNIGGVGPSQWRNLVIQGNQCGGIGQVSGFGQSPIVIPEFGETQCDSDLTGYTFEAGTCTFEELWFRTVNNGVIVGPDIAETSCSMGRMKIPGNDNWFDALQFHIHTSSEHSVDGKYYPNELHIVHRESNNNSFAVFGMFIDTKQGDEDEEHLFFEQFLRGWENAAQETHEFCQENPQGTGEFVANSVLTSRQMRLECPERPTGSLQTTEVNPRDKIPFIYVDLPKQGFGTWTYKGGLTTPPCTEIVNWNLLDVPMYISQSQLVRLTELILCFVEPSTCRHATIANEFGNTNRPPQPLNGRQVLHRCSNGPSIELADPVPPVVDANQPNVFRLERPFIVLLFPWFVAALGLVVFFLLSRYLHFFPFTAFLFLIGTGMGVGLVKLGLTDELSNSIRVWANINSELLLLFFLPGLLFRDAFCMNFHLFQKGFWQCVIMAFPMVLAGTVLLACVGFFVLPYGWSFSLAMTFGSILSATDPVAVSALLNEVGAPPRLKVHISGESLLNDGSAIVFFTIFASKFFYELNIPGLGQPVDLARGVAIFFRMSLGAVGIGIGFGLGLLQILYYLNRRFNAEESVVQVTATITVAYLCYYVADVLALTSGVIAVVTCGIMTSAFGGTLINDKLMMEKFWVLVEHLLNTILFCLGGVVWGTVVANGDKRRPETFSGTDWGYLILLYILMTAIRFFLIYAFLPIISRIGLKSNWKEAFFMSFGGLRGAVGIALAIALDNELRSDTLPGDPRRRFTSQLFGLTGGVAFLTLVINGTLSGPLLKKLGLADSGETRAKIVQRYKTSMKNHLLDVLLRLLGETRYHGVDFSIVRSHVAYLIEVSDDDLKLAVRRNRDTTPLHKYNEPVLDSFMPFFDSETQTEIRGLAKVSLAERLKNMVRVAATMMPDELSCDDIDDANLDQETLIELRKIFIELLRRSYNEQMDKGELNTRQNLLVFILNSSLAEASDRVAQGEQLCDWNACASMSNPKWMDLTMNVVDPSSTIESSPIFQGPTTETQRTIAKSATQRKKDIHDVHLVVAFVEAHRRARELFIEEFCDGRALSPTERKVFDESFLQVAEAEATLESIDGVDLANILSHLVSSVLLNEGATFIGHLVERGLLRDQEGEHYIEEIEDALHSLEACAGKECKQLDKSLRSRDHSRLSTTVKDADSSSTSSEGEEFATSNSSGKNGPFEEDRIAI